MSKVIAPSKNDSLPKYYLVWCPACGSPHSFRVPPWGFDGNLESPTVSGSLKTSGNGVECCHLHIQNGEFVYLDDCTHSMGGKKVPVPDFPEEYLPDA